MKDKIISVSYKENVMGIITKNNDGQYGWDCSNFSYAHPSHGTGIPYSDNIEEVEQELSLHMKRPYVKNESWNENDVLQRIFEQSNIKDMNSKCGPVSFRKENGSILAIFARDAIIDKVATCGTKPSEFILDGNKFISLNR